MKSIGSTLPGSGGAATSSSVTVPLALAVPSVTGVAVPVAPVRVTGTVSGPLARSSLGTCTVSVPMPPAKLTAWVWFVAEPAL
ncbi:hypothetical protein LOS8367_03744 [Limimaricola soesokkakensis]|uniref:Uncharacterized protein n=1 Tax=Limimaricola soesokkakensis TaxID=1343159 RepID=A0A1X7A8U6_9RHOB|nr:hypothetical protein LOS8367_03744 [Limimaricola soesokkakensis]